MGCFNKCLIILAGIITLLMVAAVISSGQNSVHPNIRDSIFNEGKDTATVILQLNWTRSIGKIGADNVLPSFMDQLEDTIPKLLENTIDSLKNLYHCRIYYTYFGLPADSQKYAANPMAYIHPDFKTNFIKYTEGFKKDFRQEDWSGFLEYVRKERRGLFTALFCSVRMACTEMAKELLPSSRVFILQVTDEFANSGDLLGELVSLENQGKGLPEASQFKKINNIRYASDQVNELSQRYNMNSPVSQELLFNHEKDEIEAFWEINLYELQPKNNYNLSFFMDFPDTIQALDLSPDSMYIHVDLMLDHKCLEENNYGVETVIINYMDSQQIVAKDTIHEFYSEIPISYDKTMIRDLDGNDSLKIVAYLKYIDDGIFDRYISVFNTTIPIQRKSIKFWGIFTIDGALLQFIYNSKLMSSTATATILNIFMGAMILLYLMLAFRIFVIPKGVTPVVELHTTRKAQHL